MKDLGKHEGVPYRQVHFNTHEGQQRALESTKRFVLVLAGWRSGKTETGPLWLYHKMRSMGPGNYFVVTPTFPLLSAAAGPKLDRLFSRILNLGKMTSAPRLEYRISQAGEKHLWPNQECDEQSRIVFGHADDPDSLAALQAKAAWLDEPGQRKFKLGSWEEIQARLSIDQGPCLLTTRPYCYSADTEIYTSQGWKLFGDLKPEDAVLACEPDGRAHFEKPSRIVWQDYKGPMIEMTGGRINCLVTPEHRVVFRNSKRFYVKTASEFSKLSRRSLCIPKMISLTDSLGWFTLPAVMKGHRWGPFESSALQITMADWCAFMGWFLSEGSVAGSRGGKIRRQSYRVSVCQNYGVKRDKMREDLLKLPFNWSEDVVGFHCANKQLWSYLSGIGNSETKHIPNELKRAGNVNLRVLIDRMILGDGTYRTGKKFDKRYGTWHERNGSFVYYTISERLAKDFQEICMLCGISAHIAKRCNTGGIIRGRKLAGKGFIYHVSERRRISGIVQDCKTVNYSGKIGCVSVSTGFVLVRRGGEECISGNTLGWLKDQLYDPWVKANGNHPYIDVINFPSTMNPAFPKEEDERAQRELPRWKYRMLFKGIFERPAGLIYDNFDRDKHTQPRIPIPHHWPRFVGLDFGGVNTAAVFLAQECDRDGKPVKPIKYYAYREYYPRETRTAAAHAKAILEGEPRIPYCVGGSRSEGQWRAEFQQAGLPVREAPVIDVEVGVNRVYSIFANDSIMIFSDLVGLLDEIGTYSRVLDERGMATDEIEDKETYHHLDAMRYLASKLMHKPTLAVRVV